MNETLLRLYVRTGPGWRRGEAIRTGEPSVVIVTVADDCPAQTLRLEIWRGADRRDTIQETIRPGPGGRRFAWEVTARARPDATSRLEFRLFLDDRLVRSVTALVLPATDRQGRWVGGSDSNAMSHETELIYRHAFDGLFRTTSSSS